MERMACLTEALDIVEEAEDVFCWLQFVCEARELESGYAESGFYRETNRISAQQVENLSELRSFLQGFAKSRPSPSV